MGIAQDISTIKQHYRELFQVAHQSLTDLILSLRDGYSCTQCAEPPQNVDQPLHADCGYREWQKQVIITLEQDVGKEILQTLDAITEAKEVQGQCHQCGVCCSLASSEFGYDELLQKASEGNYFAQQFTSVFVPYASHDEARERFPEVVGEILNQTGGDVHFYRCPYLGEDKRCTIYRDPRRPEICASYPETPLTLMYKKCGYQPWKTEALPVTLKAHATLELCQHYVQKIFEALS